MNPSILWQDGRCAAADKPAGLAVIPGREPGETLRQFMEEALGSKVFVVHRLDKDTSGLVLFAKDANAHRHLSMAFEGRRVMKEYLAAVDGAVAKDEGVVEAPLREAGSGRVKVDAKGKPSRTRFRVISRSDRHSLLRVQPETGRRHQIRVHLYHLGHPVLGDPLYGPAPRPVGAAPRLLLHAEGLVFPHPSEGEKRLRCAPGADFLEALRIVTLGQISYLEN